MSISNIDKIREKVEKLKKLADAMYYAAQYLTTDASRLHKAMEEYHQFIIHEYFKEEPVSEDTMTIRKEWFEHCKESWYNEGYIDGKYNRDRQFKEPVSEELEEACEQLAENARKHKAETSSPFFSQTDYIQGVMDGAKWKIAKLMKDATPVTVHIDAGGYPYIPQLELYDYDKDVPLAKEGDKYKVILIKEE